MNIIELRQQWHGLSHVVHMLSLRVASPLLRSCWEAWGAKGAKGEKGEQADKFRHPAESCPRELCRMMQSERKAWKDFGHSSWQLLCAFIIHQTLTKCQSPPKTQKHMKQNISVKVFPTYVTEVRLPISAQHGSAARDMVVAEVLSLLRHVMCPGNIFALKINMDTYRVCPFWQFSRGSQQSRHKLLLQFNSRIKTAHHTGTKCAWCCKVLHGIPRYCMVLCGMDGMCGRGTVWYCMVLSLFYGNYCMAFCGVVSYSIVLHCIVLHCMHAWCMCTMPGCFIYVYIVLL